MGRDMDDWKNKMVASKTVSTKKKIINFLVFLALWLVIYYLIKFNFGVIALILSYMMVYFRTDKQLLDGIFFLANEFDRHHNNLADELSEVKSIQDDCYLDDSIKQLWKKIEELQDEIIELKRDK